MAEIAGLVFGTSAICSIFKKCFQGYEFIQKIKALSADAEYLSSRLVIEENRLLLSGRALGLVRDDAAVERDTAAGDHNSEPDGSWLQSPEMCRIVQEVFDAIELQARIISKLKEKYNLSDLSSNSHDPIPFVRRSFSELTNNSSSNERAMQRRASFDLWKKNVPLTKKTLWAAMDNERLTQCVSQYHILNNTLDSVVTPSQQASLSQALASQIQRSNPLFEIRHGVPTLGVFERAAAESDNRYLDLSIEVERQLFVLESGAQREAAEGAFTNKAQIPSDRIEFEASDLPTSNGARDRSFATFHGKSTDDLGKTRRVLVEWKPYNPRLAKEEVDMLRMRASDIITLLSRSFPANYHLLRSFRFFDDPSNTRNQARIGLVFELPESDDRIERPRTLRDLFVDPDFPKPNLGERFKLALALAQTCLQLHTSQWLHKGLRPQNILFFPQDDLQRSLHNPYVAGFELSRMQGTGHPTEDLLSADVDIFLYCHPEKLQGARYEVRFDHYALGCLLLEIGFWYRLRDLFDSETVPLDLTRDEDQQRWKRHLVCQATQLGSEVGVIFRDVVLALLMGLDRRGKLKKDFYWDVVAQLEKCRA
ncbi:hypothetical protein MMC07_006500 [Pseudocyphellaria aurata]|nr:hypothetical protein [Pseudocyphellaria aurata]